MVQQSKNNPEVLSATTVIGDEVRNLQGEDIGEIEESMINLVAGASPMPYFPLGACRAWGTNCLPCRGKR